MVKEDPRKTGLKNGLRQLTIEQLQRVICYPGQMVLDEYNYHDGKFCPLAVAVGLDDMQDPSHEKVYNALKSAGYEVYNTRGIEGSFYTENRLDDLLFAAEEVLMEKRSKEKAASREKDQEDLKSGKITQEELGRKNSFLTADKFDIDFDKAFPLK